MPEIIKEIGATLNLNKKGPIIESLELVYPEKTIRIITLIGRHDVFETQRIINDSKGLAHISRPTIEEMATLYKEAKKYYPDEKLTEDLFYEIVSSIQTIKSEHEAIIANIESIYNEISRL